ncbi:MAG TPA: homoserine kinase [Acidobacteriota bacterium]|nr:homoserine kinase [Acidobacteriota bacterium]
MKSDFRVRVPGSTSNLGSGFDAFSAALSLYLSVDVTLVPGHGLHWPDELSSAPEENAILQGLLCGSRQWEVQLPGLQFRVHNEIPLGRGLGSSGAAFVAGLRIAEHLSGASRSREEILQLAYRLEGHPDNVAASLLGGWVLSWTDGESVCAVGLPARLECRFVTVIPELRISTADARRILPASYGLQDAVFNLQRSALLVFALLQGRGELLAEATRDRLHQPYRARLIPGAAEILAREGVPAELKDGLLAVTVSGSGSTLLALVGKEGDASAVADWMLQRLARHGVKATSRILELVQEGGGVVFSGVQETGSGGLERESG